MEYIGFIFGIFGFIAFTQVGSLRGKVYELERQLARVKGTTLHDERVALSQAAKSYIGESTKINVKEHYEDVDITMYGNTKNGSITILDVDDDWLLVQIQTPKETKEKLIRLEAVQSFSK